MEKLLISVIVAEDGTADLVSSYSESMACQSYKNAFSLGLTRAEKFIAERKVEKGITAKKEIDDAQGSSDVAEGDKDEAPEPV
ncbi:MAG: hypothetical protein KAQ85_01505 [Thermodesulfovibrionia bacterium]|nr:hypothetical protein [Thermodesulfovibrionia bacterium]